MTRRSKRKLHRLYLTPAKKDTIFTGSGPGQHQPRTRRRGPRHHLQCTPRRHQHLSGVAGGTKRKGEYIEMYSASVGKYDMRANIRKGLQGLTRA